MFNIEVTKLYWLDNSDDCDEDFCLHGDVVVDIGDEHYEESCTVSATALYLLKAITENHIIHASNQMLPCCGHEFYADKNNETVEISGCPIGIDWSVIHEGNSVNIITEKGAKTILDIEAYKKIVFDFADKIEKYYQKCSPKNIATLDDFRKNGYLVFWNEWHTRRGVAVIQSFED